MTFAKLYKDHAYADLIQEAETQGIGIGVQSERERIIKRLEADMEHAFGEDGKCVYEKHYREVCNCDLIALIKGENK